jgi:hypothetical protein
MQITQFPVESEMAGVSETAHNKLKDRVQALETAGSPSSSWIQKHQVLTWLISLTLIILSIVLSIYSGAIPHIEKDNNLQIANQMNENLKQPLQQIGQMGQDIAGIKATLNAWSPLITPQIFKKAISLPQSQFEKALPDLKAIAQVATESRAVVSSEDLSAVGQRILDVAKGSSSQSNLAWETATSLLQYRSALNGLVPPINLASAIPLSATVVTTVYKTYTRPGLEKVTLSFIGLAPKENAAALDYIGQDSNANLTIGNQFLVAQGGSLQLDKMHLKNVVLSKVHVIYEGGPVVLENVYFIDCFFEINRDAKSQALSASLIQPPPTNFSLPAS